MTRIGKIARLPHSLREQLNRRLFDGEPGVHLVAWLNSLPEARAILARDFRGHPIKAQNLSAWKTGGYVQWREETQTSKAKSSLILDLLKVNQGY